MMRPAQTPFAFFTAPSSRSSRIALALAFALPIAARAQDPKALVAAAVQNELKSDREDHSAYQYKDHDVTPDHDTLYYMVETPAGSLKRKLEDHGQPVTPRQRREDDEHIQNLLNDPAAQARARKDSAHDDGQAEAMLRLLPTAFLWTIASENGKSTTLNFRPDPGFSPGTFDAEAKVLSAMGGQVTITRTDAEMGGRISSIKGTLLNDVNFGLGIFGRLHKSGSFEVQRREVAPGHWQMTGSYVHINGRALFFKTIGSDEDETRTEFKPSSVKTLAEANEILKEVK